MQAKKQKETLAGKRKRYKNDVFLKNLGGHCKKLRVKKGYSIDRLSKEAEHLSPASIDRLEKGVADSQILVLQRYAMALDLSLLDLFSFLKDAPNISTDSRVIPYEEKVIVRSTYIPVYPIKVAAGKFSDYESIGDLAPLGWIDLNMKNNSQDYFAAYVYGESMQPRIKNGDLCLFKKYSGGSRQGKIYLIRARSVLDSETGEQFVVKKYVRVASAASEEEDRSVSVIHLVSENPRYSAIVLYGMSDEQIQTVAEFIKVI